MSDVLERLKSALADRYRIERELGSGGMATVYLAEDLKHRRQVAIKVMRPELSASLGAERFLREIQISAQLNHPNILTLIDSGEVDGTLYYVIPYLEGESLRDRMNRERQLPIEDCIEITKEAADALGYAHSKDLIHRDIKPENIMFEAGHAVLTDFGIARAVSAAGGETLTETGLAIGTPAYMSPEQATGERDIDGRSDVYSLGCVLYEMLAGEAPYSAPTPQAIIAKKLSEPLPRVSVVRETVPPAVEQVLLKALAKNRVDRFATPEEFGKALTTPSEAQWIEEPEARRRSRTRAVFGSVVAVTVAAVVIGAVLSRVMASGPITITTSNIRGVTSEAGLEWQPALSPDGDEVAFVARRGGRWTVVIRSTLSIAGGGELIPTQGLSESQESLPEWSSDGDVIRFWDCPTDPFRFLIPEGCSKKQVAKLGGSIQSIDATNAPLSSWSPDGSRIAFMVSPDSIFTYSINDGTRTLIMEPDTAIWAPHWPRWSPDGSWIAFVTVNGPWARTFNLAPAAIWIVPADGGEPVRVTSQDHMNTSPVWLDDDHLLFMSNRDGPREVYVVQVGPAGPRGEPQKVPGVSDPHSISYSIEGRKLAFSKATVRQNIWSYPIGSGTLSITNGHPVTSENAVIENHDISPDGKWIVYDADLRGNWDIYKRPLEGGSPMPLTDSPFDEFEPRWSPDGMEIAFSGGTGGNENAIWVIPAGGGTPVQLVRGPMRWWLVSPTWSPSGLELAFRSDQTGRKEVWLVSRDSIGGAWGEATQLTDFGCSPKAWTQDGRGVLCDLGAEMAVVSRDGEVLWRYNPSTDGIWMISSVQFCWDTSRICFYGRHQAGLEGVWTIPLQGGEPNLVVAYDDAEIRGSTFVSVGPDRLYVTVQEIESDIWVMDVEVER